MKFFITEAQRKTKHSTCYFEFLKGTFQNRCWNEDSIYLHADVFDALRLYPTFAESLPHFAYYGVTQVTPSQYQKLKSLALEQGGETAAVMQELDLWVENCFLTETCFTICGI